jgi:antitoxin (DNA-binding transcriptional repressor) of toxin-antitoxin stability system
MSTVGIKELKNRLTHYLRLTQKGEKVIVTDRGQPVAVIHHSTSDQLVLTREGRLAQSAAEGKICLPSRKLASRFKPVSYKGASAAQAVIEDRERATWSIGIRARWWSNSSLRWEVKKCFPFELKICLTPPPWSRILKPFPPCNAVCESHFFPAAHYRTFIDLFKRDWPAFVRFQLDEEIIILSAKLIERHPLRTLDAIHLASVLQLQQLVGEPSLFVSSDSQLLQAATAENVTVRHIAL